MCVAAIEMYGMIKMPPFSFRGTAVVLVVMMVVAGREEALAVCLFSEAFVGRLFLLMLCVFQRIGCGAG